MDSQITYRQESQDKNEQEETISHRLQVLEYELQAQQRITKNVMKFSIIIGIASFLLVAFNFSVLLTIAGGVAGSEKKIHTLQNQYKIFQEFLYTQKPLTRQ